MGQKYRINVILSAWQIPRNFNPLHHRNERSFQDAGTSFSTVVLGIGHEQEGTSANLYCTDLISGQEKQSKTDRMSQSFVLYGNGQVTFAWINLDLQTYSPNWRYSSFETPLTMKNVVLRLFFSFAVLTFRAVLNDSITGPCYTWSRIDSSSHANMFWFSWQRFSTKWCFSTGASL